MGEDMWVKIGSALLLAAMLAVAWPRARLMMQEGRRGSAAEWHSVLVPLLLVVGFVVLLILSL
jgi:hypothetical protein